MGSGNDSGTTPFQRGNGETGRFHAYLYVAKETIDIISTRSSVWRLFWKILPPNCLSLYNHCIEIPYRLISHKTVEKDPQDSPLSSGRELWTRTRVRTDLWNSSLSSYKRVMFLLHRREKGHSDSPDGNYLRLKFWQENLCRFIKERRIGNEKPVNFSQKVTILDLNYCIISRDTSFPSGLGDKFTIFVDVVRWASTM